MKLGEQVFGLNTDSLSFRRLNFFGRYGDCAIRLFLLHEFWFFSVFVKPVLGDGSKVILRSHALTFLLLVENFNVLFKDIASLVFSILIRKECISFNERRCISVIKTINDFLNIGLCLISHTSMNFLLFLAWPEIHDLLISSAFMKLVGRWLVNGIMSESILDSLNRSCRKFHAFICSESYIYWRVFCHVCITGLLIELVGSLCSLDTWDKHEVTVSNGPHRVVSLKSSHTSMIFDTLITNWRSIEGVASKVFSGLYLLALIWVVLKRRGNIVRVVSNMTSGGTPLGLPAIIVNCNGLLHGLIDRVIQWI